MAERREPKVEMFTKQFSLGLFGGLRRQMFETSTNQDMFDMFVVGSNLQKTQRLALICDEFDERGPMDNPILIL